MSPRWIALALGTVLATPSAAYAAPLSEVSAQDPALLGKPLVVLDVPAAAQGADQHAAPGIADWLSLTDTLNEDARYEQHVTMATTYSYLSSSTAGIEDLAQLLQPHGGLVKQGSSSGAKHPGDVTYTVVESHGPPRLIGPVPAAMAFGSAMCFLGVIGWVRQRRQHA